MVRMVKEEKRRNGFLGESLGYLLVFLAVIVTPALAKPASLLFKNLAYGQLTLFIEELLTVIFWGVEFLVFRLVSRKRKRQTQGAGMELSSETAREDAREKVAPIAEEEERGLPLKNVIALTLIVVFCIFLMSAQIGFKVKLFYDIGEKVTGFQMLEKLGVIVINLVKCVWICFLLRISDRLSERLLSKISGKVGLTGKKYLHWLFTGAFVMLFGIYDVLACANPFAWTYLLFYAAFTAVYFLTEKHGGKCWSLIMLIYLF